MTTTLGLVADLAPVIERGDCGFGGGCPRPAEVQVVLPDLGSDRLLCRHHVGYFMLAGTSDERVAHVLVRRLEPLIHAVAPLIRAS